MAEDTDSQTPKIIVVENELPPMRAIYQKCYIDDGQTDEEITAAFLADHPRRRIRKITRRSI